MKRNMKYTYILTYLEVADWNHLDIFEWSLVMISILLSRWRRLFISWDLDGNFRLPPSYWIALKKLTALNHDRKDKREFRLQFRLDNHLIYLSLLFDFTTDIEKKTIYIIRIYIFLNLSQINGTDWFYSCFS